MCVVCISCAPKLVCMFSYDAFVCLCAYGACELASPLTPGGTKASANYKEQRNNLHNLDFDLCHPRAIPCSHSSC